MAARSSDEALVEFAAHLIDGECTPPGFKNFTLDMTLPPSVPYYSHMFITVENNKI